MMKCHSVSSLVILLAATVSLAGCPSGGGNSDTPDETAADNGEDPAPSVKEGAASPEELIKAYNKAYRDRDWSTWLACVRPGADRELWVATEFRMAARVLSKEDLDTLRKEHGVTHIDAREVVGPSDLSALLGATMKLREQTKPLPPREVKGKVTSQGDTGQVTRSNGTTKLRRVGDRWYISSN